MAVRPLFVAHRKVVLVVIQPCHTSTITAKGGWVMASRELASETEEELRWGGDVHVKPKLDNYRISTRPLICTKPKSHQLPKEPRRDLTLSTLRPFSSYRQIFQSFWTGASHCASNPEGVETVLPQFSAGLMGVFQLIALQ